MINVGMIICFALTYVTMLFFFKGSSSVNKIMGKILVGIILLDLIVAGVLRGGTWGEIFTEIFKAL